MNLAYLELFPTQVMEKSERRWLLYFAGMVMLVTSLPYLLGFAVQGEGWAFTGFVFGVEDGNSYLAKMLSGNAGAWLFRTPYTPYPQDGVVAFLPYMLVGKLATPPGLHTQLAILFHLFRLGAGLLAILATWDFLTIFIKSPNWRRAALALSILGGGLGWVFLVLGKSSWLGSLPLEYYSPETFGFLGVYGIPHLALARAALLWALSCYLKGLSAEGERPFIRAGLKMGGIWLVLALAQPLTAVVLGAILGLHLLVFGLWQGRCAAIGRQADWGVWWCAARMTFIAGLVPAPFLLYTALSFQRDPFLRAWTAQNLIPSPHPLHYLLAYGLLLPFAISGAWTLIRKSPVLGLMPVAWCLALPFLAYAPINIQRRLPEGIWVALVILAVSGLESLMGGIASPLQQSKINGYYPWAAYLFLAFPSTLILIAGGFLSVTHPNPPIFRPMGEIKAFESLAGAAMPGDIVLSAYETGNALPAWAPVRVVIGHGPETAGLAELQPQVAEFFNSDASDGYRLGMIHRLGVRYVFWGPQERNLGDWQAGDASYLEEVYQGEEYSVFKVVE